MNRFQKKILTIAAGLTNIGLALSAAAIATYAWFSANTSSIIFEDQENVSIKSDGNISITYEVLKYDDNLKEGVSFQGNASNFQLRHYDRYIPYNNKYENAVIRAGVKISDFTPGDEIAIDISCSQLNDFLDNNGKVNKFSSNVIQFKSAVVSCKTNLGNTIEMNQYIEDEIGDDGFLTNAALAYETSRVYFANQTRATSFVSCYNHTASKNHYTITNIPYISTAQLGQNETIESVVLYLQVSYNQFAVDYYIDNHVEDGVFDFGGDISEIYFKTQDGVDGGYQKVDSNNPFSNNTTDYLAVYDSAQASLGGAVALDGYANSSQINSNANFIPVEIDANNVIDATSIIQKSDLNIQSTTGGYSIGTEGAGFIGNDVSDSSSNGIISHETTPYANSISNTGVVSMNKTTGNTQYDLRFDSTSRASRFGYYDKTAQDDPSEAISLYAYNGSYKAPVLSSITATANNNNNKYNVGDSINFANRFTVVAAYVGSQTTKNVQASCRLNDDIDMNTPGKQTIWIYYTENNITARTSAEIEILATPFLTLDRNEVTVMEGKTTTVTVSASNMGDSLSYTWSGINTSTATATSGSATTTITGVSEGDTSVTVTVVGDFTKTATVTIHVIPASETRWVRVTDVSQLIEGDNVIIAMPTFGETNYAVGAQTYNNNYHFRQLASINVVNDNQISLPDDYDVSIFKLGFSGDYYTFKNNSNYLCSMESGNNLNEESTITDNSKWAISISSGIATIVAQAGESTIIRYNSSANRFSCYTSSSSITALASIFREVVGNPVTSLTFTGTPSNQVAGLQFNAENLTFTASYMFGGTATISASNIVFNGGNPIANDQTYLIATYTEAGITVSVLIDWDTTTVNELIELEITGTPNKTTYLTGSTFDPTGLTIRAHYTAGWSTLELNDPDLHYYVKSDYDASPQVKTETLPRGNNVQIEVEYAPTGFDSLHATLTPTSTVNLTVVDKTYDSLTVSQGSGAKTQYIVGETFSFDNFIVTANYNEANPGLVTPKVLSSGYTWTYTTPDGTYTSSQIAHKFNSDDVSDSITVTVSYTDSELNATRTDTFTISVSTARIFTLYQENTLSEGYYIITYGTSAIGNTVNSSKIQPTTVTISNNTITNNSDDTIVYYISANDTNWQFRNKALEDADSSSYIRATQSSGTNVSFDTQNASGTNWSASKSGNAFYFESTYNSRYLSYYNSVFGAYASNNKTALTLYKLNYTPSTITSVSIDSSPTSNVHSVNAEDTLQLVATVSGTGSYSSAVTWSSSDTSVATVDSSGLVTGVDGGTATITATSVGNSSKSDTYSVTVVAKTKLNIDSTNSTAYSNSKWEIDEQTNNKTVIVTRTAGFDANTSGQGTVASITWSKTKTGSTTDTNYNKISLSGNGTLTCTITAGDVDADTTFKVRATLGNGEYAEVEVTVKAAGTPSTTTITDTINRSVTSSLIGNTGTSSWTDITVTGSSGAVYKIHTMGISTEAIRWNKNGYLYVSTTATNCVKIQSITITTTASKSIGLYGSNTAYTASPSSTSITTMSCTSSGTTYDFVSNNKDYKYFGLKGTASSTYVVSISITWVVNS